VWKKIATITIGILALWFCYSVVDGNGWMLRVPPERDPRLVGKWRRLSETMYPDVFLAADGSGLSLGRPLQWGTSGGRIYLKYLATDAWVLTERRYEISEGLVKFERGSKWGRLPPEMKRISR
jgi:hypothetical protein